MNKPLYVYYDQQLVGLLTQTTSHTMQFAYDDAWLRGVEHGNSSPLTAGGEKTRAARRDQRWRSC